MKNIPSVSSLVAEIKHCLEGQFRYVQVIGEISNLSRSTPGHFYFSLSDDKASLSCALFRLEALQNPSIQKLKDGDKIIVAGPLGVYSKRGTFQLIVKKITPVGKGDLREQLEKLKKKLAAEGLFDLDQKQKIPLYPKRIGLITAERGAALQDFLNITKRRTLWADLLLSPALVQGIAAPASLRQALHRLIEYHIKAPPEKKIDVIVLTRGGGSLEDLWAFNDEALAWDLYNCPIPTISAVGHEVDFSISDMVADYRCETPSAAAEILSTGQVRLQETLDRLGKNFHRLGREILYRHREKLHRRNPRLILDIIQKRWSLLDKRLKKADPRGRLMELTDYHNKVLRLEDLNHRLFQILPKRSQGFKARLEKNNEMLRLLNPENILGRGYTYLQDPQGNIVTSKKKFSGLYKGALLSVKFYDGTAQVQK